MLSASEQPASASGLTAQSERVTRVVGNVLDLGHLVVVGQDDRVRLLRERADLALERGEVFELQKWLHAVQAAFRLICSGIPCVGWPE
jgi:hypothetical protein